MLAFRARFYAFRLLQVFVCPLFVFLSEGGPAGALADTNTKTGSTESPEISAVALFVPLLLALPWRPRFQPFGIVCFRFRDS